MSHLVSDITGGYYKTATTCFYELFWSIGIITLLLLYHFSKSWTDLYIYMSYPSILLLLVYKWIPDSPRWMVNHGRIREAAMIIEKAAEYNGKPLTYKNTELIFALNDLANEKAPEESPFREMWKGKGVKKNLILCHLAWSIYIIINYGFLLNVRPFGRQFLEINTAICGVCEIIGLLIGWTLIMRTERKWTWAGLMNSVASAISLTAFLVPDECKLWKRKF